MGLYAIDCSICKTPFMWFSGGNQFQLCQECMKTATFHTGELVKDIKQSESVPSSISYFQLNSEDDEDQ